MTQIIYQVDSFTDQPFRGNPAGVCVLDGPADAGWMHSVAAEMALSETAFLYPEQAGYNLRWFTPTVEIDLCGHATLASAHILWQTGALAPEQEASFYTKSGLLTARKDGEWITLNFPANPPREIAAPDDLTTALELQPLYVGQGGHLMLVEVATEQEVRDARPDFGLLATLPTDEVILTSRGEGEYDFISRLFAPAIGINEDPVTGASHCVLGPYWQAKLGKSEFIAYQASARGGVIKVAVLEDRVEISSQAVTVLKCELVGESLVIISKAVGLCLRLLGCQAQRSSF